MIDVTTLQLNKPPPIALKIAKKIYVIGNRTFIKAGREHKRSVAGAFSYFAFTFAFAFAVVAFAFAWGGMFM